MQPIKILRLAAVSLLLTAGVPLLPAPVSPLPAVAQTMFKKQDRQAEANRLLKQGIQQFQTSQYQAALQSWQQALAIFQAIKDRNGEANALMNLGNAYLPLSQYNKAIEYYQQALPLFRAVQDRNGEASTLNNLGATYGSLSQYNKEIEYYQQALPIYRAVQNRNGEAKALRNLGEAYFSLSQYNKAIEYYQQALPILRAVQNRNEEAKALGNLGEAYRSLSQYTKAIEYYQQALPILRAVQDRNGEASTLNNLGIAYFSLSQYNKAIEYYQQALPILRAMQDRNGEASTLNNLGSAYGSLSQYNKAVEYSQQALLIYQAVGDRSGEARALNNLGNAYGSLSQYKKEVEYYQQALLILRAVGDRNGEARALGNLGNAYFSLAQYTKAIEFFQQALPIFRAVQDRNGEAKALGSLGSAYGSLSQYKKEVEYYQQALLIFREVGDRNGEASALGNLGIAYGSLSQYTKAIEFYQQALPIYRAVGDRNGEASALGNLGSAYNSLSQHNKAVEYSQQALPIYREVGDRAGEGKLLSNIGIFLENQKQPELAIAFYKQSVNVRETIRDGIRKLSREEQASYTQSVESSYRNLADLLLKQNRVMEAMQVLDLLKVQELQDYLKDIKGNQLTAQGLPLLPQEREIVQAFKQNPAISETVTSSAVTTLVAQLRQTAAAQNLTLPAYKDLQARIQKLGKNIALFYPLILDDRLELVLFIPDRPPIRKTVNVKRAEFEREIGEFRKSLPDLSALPKIRKSAQQLYTWLVQPIDAELKAAKVQTIVYAPDGQMRYVPLAALHDGTQWLTERYQINYLMALALTPIDAPDTRSPSAFTGALTQGKTITVAGNTYSFGSLAYTQAEVNQIAKTIPNTKSLIDQPFNRKNLVAQMPQASIVHLATHAKFGGTPEESFIVLGDGDVVTLREIEAWKLPNVSLFVLSACETGLGGKLGNGLEILGFGYQMQRTGSRAAIASLWSVDDGGTSVLMSQFYAALQKGNSKTEALHQAQIELINSGNYRHPLYWAPFILIGNGL